MSTSVLRDPGGAGTAEPDDVVRSIALEAAIVLYRRRAIHEVSVEDVAAAAGLDPAVLKLRFPSIHDLLLATIAVRHGRRNTALASVATGHGAVAYLREAVIANLDEPALMRLLMGAASIAATSGHPIAPVLRLQWVQFHATVHRALAKDIGIGREPMTEEPSHGAEQLIAIYEGLQVQASMRPHMDVLESHDRAMVRLRDGWAVAWTPAVREL